MMTRHLLAVPLCFALAMPLSARAQPAAAQQAAIDLRRDIQAWPELSVDNEATKPDGDVVIPRHSVGFAGNWGDRVELFEERLHLTRNLEKLVAFNPNADVLFAGALIQGKSLPLGVLSPISAPRTPQTCTVTDLVGAGPDARLSATITPTLANVTLFVTQVLGQQLAQQQPAKMTYSETRFSSIEEGLLRLGASFSWMSGNVSGSFERKRQEDKTQLMVRFVQSYFTVSCEVQSSPDPLSYFVGNTNFVDLRNYMGQGNPPTYIASVTYGRELWMLIDSSRTEAEVKSMLDAAVSLGMSHGEVQFNDSQRTTINDSSIQVLVLGGGGKPAVGIVTGNPAQLQGYLDAGANFSVASPGVPISYTVRYLKNNDVARVSSSTDYTVKTAVNSPVSPPLIGGTATWRTTGENKDWNTQPVVDIYDPIGRQAAHIDCCSSSREHDQWNRGSTETRSLKIIGGLTKADLTHGRLSAIRNARGKDDWDYSLDVDLTFADGSGTHYKCNGRNSCGTNW